MISLWSLLAVLLVSCLNVGPGKGHVLRKRVTDFSPWPHLPLDLRNRLIELEQTRLASCQTCISHCVQWRTDLNWPQVQCPQLCTEHYHQRSLVDWYYDGELNQDSGELNARAVAFSRQYDRCTNEDLTTSQQRTRGVAAYRAARDALVRQTEWKKIDWMPSPDEAYWRALHRQAQQDRRRMDDLEAQGRRRQALQDRRRMRGIDPLQIMFQGQEAMVGVARAAAEQGKRFKVAPRTIPLPKTVPRPPVMVRIP